MKGLLFLYGETFRKGGKFSRNIGSDESYTEQKKACESHVSLINHLNIHHGCECDVIISTYDTQYTSELVSWYPRNTKFYRYSSNNVMINHHDCLKETSSEMYDFVFQFRPDLYFKSHFIHNIFNPKFDEIFFFSVCSASKNWHKTPKENPRINDVMVYIPRRLKAFYLLRPSHNIIDVLPKHIFPEHVDFMVYEYYDSDSQKDLNPAYKIVNRPESIVTLTPSERTVPWDFPIFKNKIKRLDK